MTDQAVQAVLELYPRIFFACHRRHVPDPATRRLVSEHQVSILAHLDEVEPLSMTALAAHMGVTPGTMSLNVQRLSRRGYVLRRRDRRDNRRVLLRLSPAGARVRDAQSVLEPDLVRSMVSRLAPQDRADAVRGLELLAQAATEEMRARGRRGRGNRGVRRTRTFQLSHEENSS